MIEAALVILKMSAPLLFLVLGALLTEYSGSLAVFMEGAVILSAFFCALITIISGNPFLGFIVSVLLTSLILYLLALFTVKTRANYFLTGLSLNLFAAGFVSWASELFLKKGGVLSFEDFEASSHLVPVNNLNPFFAGLILAIVIFVLLKYSSKGISLKYSGEAPDVLIAHGINPNNYKIFSWTIAGFFAACAGSTLVFRLAAYTPNISAGRGWTALAAIFLGNKNPLLCTLAVLLFSSAEYAVNIMQGTVKIPSGILLAVPYITALIFFIAAPSVRKK